mgnify:CR=1 FL=1
MELGDFSIVGGGGGGAAAERVGRSKFRKIKIGREATAAPEGGSYLG